MNWILLIIFASSNGDSSFIFTDNILESNTMIKALKSNGYKVTWETVIRPERSFEFLHHPSYNLLGIGKGKYGKRIKGMEYRREHNSLTAEFSDKFSMDYICFRILEESRNGGSSMTYYGDKFENTAFDMDILRNNILNSDKVQSLVKAGYYTRIYFSGRIELYISWNKSKVEQEVPF